MAEKLFAPFTPDASNPFDARKAAHLLRRAGFGARPDEVQAAVERGLEATVDELFSEADGEAERLDQIRQAVSGRLLNFGDAGTCQAWWLFRMVTTACPLKEKLTLFWHGHFATSVAKVGDTELLMQQIDALRASAWGSFRDLVLAMAKDPAMLVWLDGESNGKEHPNENFARELMELFTCGIGNYTEADVLEAARAFTGWHREGNKFVFHADAHDVGVKRVLGRRGKLDGGDVIDILLSLPATPRFLAKKLLRFFAAGEPSDAAVAEAAAALERTRLNVKWFLRELFLSQYFFSPECYRTRIASPVEYAVGIVRSLGVRQPTLDLVGTLAGMGQELLAPPNVKGWDGEQKWIHSTALAVRTALAKQISELKANYGGLAPHCPVEELVPPAVNTAEGIVDRWAELLFQGELPESVRRELVALARDGIDANAGNTLESNPDFREAKVRSVLAVMLALPEFQVV